MSVDISSSKNSNKGTASAGASSSLYETKTLHCKNQCGYFGNSMQYDGYCSICYRRMKNASRQHQLPANSGPSLMFSSPSFDDSTSLLGSSYALNGNEKSNDPSMNGTNSQIWNEQKNFSKFSSKKDTKNSGKSSIKSIFRRPSTQQQISMQPGADSPNISPYKHSSSALNLAETVSKVADKAVNLVDQSLFNMTNSSSSNSNMFNDTSSLIEFTNCLNRLLSPSASSSSNSNKLNSSYYDNNSVLNEFEKLFKINFPQFYADLIKQLKQFVDKFLDAFKQQQQRMTKDKQHLDNNKQFEVVQEFFKKIYKYILTSALIKSHLERLSTVISVFFVCLFMFKR